MPRKPRNFESGTPVHITGKVRNGSSFPIPLAAMWRIFESRFWFAQQAFGLGINAVVLMPNHFHAIVTPSSEGLSKPMNWVLSRITNDVNEMTGSVHQLWGRRYWPSVIHDDCYLWTCYRYVYQNPVRARLSVQAWDYPFSTLPSILGLKGEAGLLVADPYLWQNTESTLEWLAREYSPEQTEIIRRGFFRTRFGIPKDPQTGYRPTWISRKT